MAYYRKNDLYKYYNMFWYVYFVAQLFKLGPESSVCIAEAADKSKEVIPVKYFVISVLFSETWKILLIIDGY